VLRGARGSSRGPAGSWLSASFVGAIFGPTLLAPPQRRWEPGRGAGGRRLCPLCPKPPKIRKPMMLLWKDQGVCGCPAWPCSYSSAFERAEALLCCPHSLLGLQARRSHSPAHLRRMRILGLAKLTGKTI